MEATTERRLEKGRRSRDQAMEAALTGSTQGLVVTDAFGRAQLTNERARSLLGMAVGEGVPLSAPPAGCFLPDGVTAFPEDRWPVLRTLGGERVEQELLHFRSADGAPGRWLCASSWPLSGTGSPSGAVLAVHEISEESVGPATSVRSSGPRDFPPPDVGFRGCVACVERVGTLRQRHGLVMRAVRQTADSVVITELHRAQERELYMDLAQEVQRRFYRVPSAPPGYEVAAAAQPAHLTGGDYFDILPGSDGSLCLVIGDVVGHGFGAALVMAGLRASVRACVRAGADPGEILSRLNPILLDDLATNQFVTLLVVQIEPDTGAVRYASAGHTSGHIVRTDPARGTELPSTGLPLGLFPERIYETLAAPPVASGDMLVLVTDGIVETTSPADEEFGTERLLSLVREQFNGSTAALLDRLGGEVQRFAGGRDQQDDLTSVICRRL